jgi:hypothetical protein
MAYLAAPQLDFAGGNAPLSQTVLATPPFSVAIPITVFNTVTVPDIESLIDVSGGTVGYSTG